MKEILNLNELITNPNSSPKINIEALTVFFNENKNKVDKGFAALVSMIEDIVNLLQIINGRGGDYRNTIYDQF